MCRQDTLNLIREIQNRSQAHGNFAVRVVVMPSPGNEQSLLRGIVRDAFAQDVLQLQLLPGQIHVLVPQDTSSLDMGEARPLVVSVHPSALEVLVQPHDTSEPEPFVLVELDHNPHLDPQERLGTQISYFEPQQPAPPQGRLSLDETIVFLRNLAGAMTPVWRDNFSTPAARISQEREGVGGRLYEFSLQHLSDRDYRNLVIAEAWAKDFPVYLELLKDHHVLCLTGQGTGVDFFARLLLRRLAEEEGSPLRRGLQFTDCETFRRYRAQNVVGAGFILRHFLDYFLDRRRQEDAESFHALLRDDLVECLRRLKENDSYLILTCSQALTLREFEREAARSSTEASFPELCLRWDDALPDVPLESVFRRLPNRVARIVRAMSLHWNWESDAPHTHVGHRVRPRFRR